MVKIKKHSRGSDIKDGIYWLNLWERFSLCVPTCCAVMGCECKDLIGVQVQNMKKQSAKDSYYILPMCKKHSEFSSALLTDPYIPMIPVKIDMVRDENERLIL